MDEIYRICKLAMECIVSGDHTFLDEQGALTRVSWRDIERVLTGYDPSGSPVMPPDGHIEEAAHVIGYRDGSGCHVDIDLWYPSGRSDLTLQLDIRRLGGRLFFTIDDLRVL